MKKFLSELAKVGNHLNAEDTLEEAERKYKEVRDHYRRYVKQQAMYKSGRSESRVVTIEEIHRYYILLSYTCYGMDYTETVRTCSTISSLICGEDRLEL